jgi:ADP-heptose:LPS heptosyltransferase
MRFRYSMKKILIIQTAFIGDVILATPVVEKLHRFFPEASIDFLLRKGNESLLTGHPYISEIIVWNKKENKINNLFKIISKIKNSQYDLLVNIHRFASSGLVAFLSRAKIKCGFDKNPFSLCYDIRINHRVGNHVHETARNLSLIEPITDSSPEKPRLYPSSEDAVTVRNYTHEENKIKQYITIAPASVWFTKQFPIHKWIELINKSDESLIIYLIGASSDTFMCDEIIKGSTNKNIINLAGKLTFLQSAELMKHAVMNYANDSAPLHMASAMNAPVTAIFCSTIPAFGFGPLSDNSSILELQKPLYCRPCGLHGFRRCPEGHFKCAEEIVV